jgi:hypothetical protein
VRGGERSLEIFLPYFSAANAAMEVPSLSQGPRKLQPWDQAAPSWAGKGVQLSGPSCPIAGIPKLFAHVPP